MVLRLISGPMPEKSNRTGPLADRKKVVLSARHRVFFSLGFSTTRETGNFCGSFFELDYFDIFSDFQHFSMVLF